MNDLLYSLGLYGSQLHVASYHNYKHDKGLIAVLVAFGWVLLPFMLQTLLHPSDMILLLYKLQGLKVPRSGVSNQQFYVGIAITMFLLVVLVVFEWVGMVLFFRHAQINNARLATPALWPLAAILTGVFGNLAWLLALGSFDPYGCFVGLFSAGVTIIGEIIVEELGRDFVLGAARSNQHPPLNQQSW